MTVTKLLHADLTYYIRGIGYQIHSELGASHAESDYETALVYALQIDGIQFRQQPLYRIEYRGKQVGEYRPDIVVADGTVLLELKATSTIEPLHKAQTLSYLRVTDCELGLIMNFGGRSMSYERLPNFAAQRVAVPFTAQVPEDNLYPALSRHLLDLMCRVHVELGSGFLHQVYRRATRIELAADGLSVTYLKELPLRFRQIDISKKPVRLFHVENRMLLATVAVRKIEAAHVDKMRWALRMTGCKLGLIGNFYPSALAFRFVRLA